MKLEAYLTVGWEDDPRSDVAAARLHQAASHSGADYSAALAAELAKMPRDTAISGLDKLFRRRSNEFRPLKQFIGAVASMPAPENVSEPLFCRIDVFAYAFLKSAKNLDFLLPRRKGGDDDFGNVSKAWAETITALECLERTGEPLPSGIPVTADAYLAIREIISRPSARDELRALVVLLTSGPSTLAEISGDLGLNYTLGQRTLAAYERVGALEHRPENVFSIAKNALPLVVFCLREKMGIDLLPSLPGE